MNFRYYRFKKRAKYKPYRKINLKLITPEIENYLKYIKKRLNFRDLETTSMKKLAMELVGFTLKCEDLNKTVGYCDGSGKIIVINSNKNLLRKRKIFCHEFGHAIQYTLGTIKNSTSLAYQLYIEQQAETIAYILFDMFFPYLKEEKKKLKFNSYFSFNSIKFLEKQFGNIRNDVYYRVI